MIFNIFPDYSVRSFDTNRLSILLCHKEIKFLDESTTSIPIEFNKFAFVEFL